MSTNDNYFDPWTDYSRISQKIRKRAFKWRTTTYVSEAAREYSLLARRLKNDEISDQYAALSHLSAARCEQQCLGDHSDCTELEAAAHLFAKCATEHARIKLYGFEQHTTSFIHCFAHAIRCHIQHHRYIKAANDCVELANALISLDEHSNSTSNVHEAIQWLKKAITFVDSDPAAKCLILKQLAIYQLQVDDSSHIIPILDEIWSTAARIDQESSNKSSRIDTASVTAQDWRRLLLRSVEIATILVLLNSETLPALMNERHLRIFNTYTKSSSIYDQQFIVPSDSYLADDNDDFQMFLILQSFAQSIRDPSASFEEVDETATILIRNFDALSNSLIIDLVLRRFDGQQ